MTKVFGRLFKGKIINLIMLSIVVNLAFICTKALAEEEEVNNGQDFTKPLTRFDIRQKYQDLPGDKFSSATTLRVDKPFVLDNHWIASTRFDLPFAYTDVPSTDNSNGDKESGVSDSLIQVLMVAPMAGREWTWAYGFQALFPTATHDEMGTGRFQFAPTWGAKVNTPALGKGAWAALLIKNYLDVGGDGDRADVNQLSIQPVLNINLPKRWFVTLAPDMRVNWEDNGSWFIPFDVTIGKMLNRTTVCSVEYKTPIHDDYEIYDHEVEARIGFFF